MKVYSLTGIVLKKNTSGDSDRLYTIYSKEKGKIAVVAKGVRKINSRRNPHLDTLNLIKFSVRESKSKYKTIEEVKAQNSFKYIKEEHENPDQFELLQQSLSTLENNLIPLNYVVSAFEVRLMKLLGYELYLDKCASCGRKFDDSWTSHKFSFELGGLCRNRCNNFGMELSNDSAETLYLLSLNKKKKNHNMRSLSEITNIINTFTLYTLGQRVKSFELLRKI